MSPNETRAALVGSRLRGVGIVIVTAAIVFAVLAIANTLALVYALASFAVVAAVALIALRGNDESNSLTRPATVAERGNDLLRAVVAGLPDPVIALDRD